MFKKTRLSIALKINAAILALICLTVLVLSRVFINAQVNTVKAELKSRGVTLTNNLAYNSELGVLAKDADSLYKLLKVLTFEKDVVYGSISDSNGNIISETGSRHKTDDTSIDVFTSQIKTKVIPESLGKEGVAIFFQQDLPEEVIGEAYVELSLDNLYKTIVDIRHKTLLLTVILIVLAFILTLFVTRLIIGPLLGLVEATKRVSSGELDYKVKVYSNDEIGDLALSFNEMTENLKNTYEKLEKRTKELEVVNKNLQEAQYQLVQSTKMAAIGQLGAGVAHELNNPLGGVLGYAQYVMQKVRKPGFTADDFSTCTTYLGHIEREALRCKTIVENLLKFSRGPKKEMEDVEINRVIKETMPLTSHGLRSHKINIVESYSPDLPVVNGNFNKLQQVMVNMIINAEQAMPEGGQLTIATRAKRGEGNKPSAVIIEMEDTGCGIAPENISRLFEPFFTTKQNSKGTGLGLTVSYEIIQEHGGDISVDSQVNRGTKFTITIPSKNG